MGLAATKGHLGVLETLLDLGVPVDQINPLGSTALHAAAVTPQLEAATLLLARGADPTRPGAGGLTPLHATAFNTQRGGEMAALLIDHGADIDARNKHRATALLLAAQQGNVSVIRTLLERGADRNLRAIDGTTPVQAARAAEKPEAAAALALPPRG
jgi:ankyrin repeat protein